MELAEMSDESMARLEEEVAEAERRLQMLDVSIRAAEVEAAAARDPSQFTDLDPANTGAPESQRIAKMGVAKGVVVGIGTTIFLRLVLLMAGY